MPSRPIEGDRDPMEQAMGSLSEPERRLVWMAVVERRPMADIAAVIDRDVPTTRQLVHGAKAAFVRAFTTGSHEES